MTASTRERERIRWRCRRGMLELDLVLSDFLEEHLDALDPAGIEAFKALLALPDPDLLDFVMGHRDPENPRERELVALMRKKRSISTV